MIEKRGPGLLSKLDGRALSLHTIVVKATLKFICTMKIVDHLLEGGRDIVAERSNRLFLC